MAQPYYAERPVRAEGEWRREKNKILRSSSGFDSTVMLLLDVWQGQFRDPFHPDGLGDPSLSLLVISLSPLNSPFPPLPLNSLLLSPSRFLIFIFHLCASNVVFLICRSFPFLFPTFSQRRLLTVCILPIMLPSCRACLFLTLPLQSPPHNCRRRQTTQRRYINHCFAVSFRFPCPRSTTVATPQDSLKTLTLPTLLLYMF